MLTNLPRVVYGRLLVRHTDAEKQTDIAWANTNTYKIYNPQVPQDSCPAERGAR
jgi:hypothetical protein